jgi:hypothetical protein
MSLFSGRLKATFVGVLIACLQMACGGGANDGESTERQPQELKSDEVAKLLQAEYADDALWISRRSGIASGSDEALRQGLAMYLVADGGAKQMLAQAFGEALGAQAEKVLFLARESHISVGAFCTAPDVDDDRFSTLELATEELEKRLRAVTRVSRDELSSERQQCVDMLNQSRKGLSEFFRD